MKTNSKMPGYVDEGTPLVQFVQKGGQRGPRVVDAADWETKRWRLMLELFVIFLLVFISIPFVFDLRGVDNGASSDNILNELDEFSSMSPVSGGVRVGEGNPTFPSYNKCGRRGPIRVTYDERSILLNDTRVLFLSGSLHPARATPQTWNSALDEAVRHGLNMITIYVFWSAHQPFPDQAMDWSLPNGDWTLASSIQEAANRGFFVHIRIGPYTCAEYNYGGIPEWVPLQHPDMEMRRPNALWMQAMEQYVVDVVGYLTDHKLWAYQGGPIILGQIENELQPLREASGTFMDVDNNDKEGKMAEESLPSSPSMQDHAEWCGELAARVAPEVVWTMCNGLSASNTINTCNGLGEECSVTFLESHGQSGRIQVDQPALWTELEGGFQVWGEGPSKPSRYFWGRAARSYARETLKWFARGGSHVNYYMWWGSYNRGRAAGSGITNMYASDAPMCPSGERRQPKFDHLRSLHELIADVSHTLMNAPSALGAAEPVEHWNETTGGWAIDRHQRIFVYQRGNQEVLFVENDAEVIVDLRIPVRNGTNVKMQRMMPTSSVVLVNGAFLFDSATVSVNSMSYERRTKESPVQLLSMHAWSDLTVNLVDDQRLILRDKPVEQTELMFETGLLSDYAWYQTSFTLGHSLDEVSLSIDTQKGSAMVIFVDESFVGEADNHEQVDGNTTLSIDFGQLSKGDHTLYILSESLGYSNIVSTWGASTKAKTKGITGSVVLGGTTSGKAPKRWSQNLVDGRTWSSFAGLHTSAEANDRRLDKHGLSIRRDLSPFSPCSWSKAFFDTPIIHQMSLFLDITMGRGRIWLNGHDLGRFWNITRGEESKEPTQRYYFLPKELLFDNGKLNELVMFNSLGGDTSSVRLILSWLEASDKPNFLDEIDFPSACLT